MNIRQAAITASMSEEAVRRAIRLGKLHAELVPLGSSQSRYEITEDDIRKYRAEISHNQRPDGRNKYISYMTPAERAQVMQLLQANNLTEVAALLKRANPSKS